MVTVFPGFRLHFLGERARAGKSGRERNCSEREWKREGEAKQLALFPPPELSWDKVEDHIAILSVTRGQL